MTWELLKMVVWVVEFTNDAYHGGGGASWDQIQKWNGTNWSTLSPSETSLHTGANRGVGTGVVLQHLVVTEVVSWVVVHLITYIL